MSDKQFKDNFRVTRSTFGYLVRELICLKKMDTYYRKAISLDKRIAVSLYMIGSSSELRTVANLFGIGLSTLHQMMFEFLNAVIVKFSTKHLSFYPANDEEIKNQMFAFEKLWGFPQVVGCVGE